MASHRNFRTIYFKSCDCRVLPILYGYIPNHPKSDVISQPLNKVPVWWAKLIKFHPFISRSLHWHHTETPLPFISKVMVAKSCQFCTDIYIPINPKSDAKWQHTRINKTYSTEIQKKYNNNKNSNIRTKIHKMKSNCYISFE